MTNEGFGAGQQGGEGMDQVWPEGVNWDLGMGGSHVSETVWRCDALRAGRLYNRALFGSRAEAEMFAHRMRQAEPDQVFRVEAIEASAVWN